jgi:hypothetical protein
MIHLAGYFCANASLYGYNVAFVLLGANIYYICRYLEVQNE